MRKSLAMLLLVAVLLVNPTGTIVAAVAVTAGTNAPSYAPGSQVLLSGQVSGDSRPPGATVSYTVQDSQGSLFASAQAPIDAAGAYAATFTLPAAPVGLWTISVSFAGATTAVDFTVVADAYAVTAAVSPDLVSAGQSLTVSGMVTDQGRPLPGAAVTVSLRQPNDAVVTTRQVVTGAGGGYSLTLTTATAAATGTWSIDVVAARAIATATFQVRDGATALIAISPAGDLWLQAGGSVDFAVAGYNAAGEPVPVGTVAWSTTNAVEGATGSITPGGRFTAAHPGRLQVQAVADGQAAVSGAITIAPGPVAAVSITTATTVAAGSTLPLTAEARDAGGYVVAPVSFQWTMVPGTGTARLAGSVLTGARTGTVAVVATAAGGQTAQATVTVIPGPVSALTITSESALLVGGSVHLSAAAGDAEGNPVPAPQLTWSLVAGAGLATVNGATLVGLQTGSVTVSVQALGGVAATQTLTIGGGGGGGGGGGSGGGGASGSTGGTGAPGAGAPAAPATGTTTPAAGTSPNASSPTPPVTPTPSATPAAVAAPSPRPSGFSPGPRPPAPAVGPGSGTPPPAGVIVAVASGTAAGEVWALVDETMLRVDQLGPTLVIDLIAPAGEGDAASAASPESPRVAEIPLAVLDQMAATDRDLTLLTGYVSLTIPPRALTDASVTQAAQGAGRVVMAVRVAPVDPAAQPATQAALDSAAARGLSPAGRVISLQAEARSGPDGPGQSPPQPVHDFADAITVWFPYETDANPDFLAVYRLDRPRGEWRLVGGRVDRTTATIAVKLRGFSEYTVLHHARTFSDIQDHWARSDIEIMASREIARGTSDTHFVPDGQVTRAQFAALLVRALRIPVLASAGTGLRDVSADAWYARDVATAVAAGLLQGDGVDFRPDASITRQEVAVILARAAAHRGRPVTADPTEVSDLLSRFSDRAALADWAAESVARVVKAGLVSGRGEGQFAPMATASRAETAVLLKRLLVHSGDL